MVRVYGMDSVWAGGGTWLVNGFFAFFLYLLKNVISSPSVICFCVCSIYSLLIYRLDLLTFLSNQVSKTSIKKGFIFFKHFITLRGITQRSYTSHSLRFKNAVSQSRVVDFRRTQWYYSQCAAFLNRGMFDHSEIDVFVAPGSEVIESHLLLLGAQGLWEQNRTSQAERTKQLTPHFQLNSRV